MAARLGELPGLHAARTLLDSFGQQALDAAAAALLAAPQPADDPAWVELCNRFRDQVQIFDHFAADHSLNAFLDYQALVTGADTVRQERLAGKVNLMTLHNAKGTEYPVVIIIGLEEENLPLWTTLKRGDFLLEERRVFYVGMTRAKQQLYLTSVRQRGDGFTRIASRFAFELPARYVRRYRVGERGEVREVE
jgi:superfamily I DNA/RNA helicase